MVGAIELELGGVLSSSEVGPVPLPLAQPQQTFQLTVDEVAMPLSVEHGSMMGVTSRFYVGYNFLGAEGRLAMKI